MATAAVGRRRRRRFALLLALLSRVAEALRLPGASPPARTRRVFFVESGAALTALSVQQPARAAVAQFDSIRFELGGGGSGGMAELKDLLALRDTAGLVKLTREYSGYLKGNLMAKAAKSLTDPAAKDRAKELSNAVLEDLIAINKLARADDFPRAQSYYESLEADLEAFLLLENEL